MYIRKYKCKKGGLIILINTDKILNNHRLIYAHKDDERVETLIEHSQKVIETFYQLDKEKKIRKKLRDLMENMNIEDREGSKIQLKGESKNLIEKMFINAIYMHDWGKVNPKYQVEKMSNHKVKELVGIAGLNDSHSPLSAAIYIDSFYEATREVLNPVERVFLQLVLFAFAFVIYSHHGDMGDFSEWVKELNYSNRILSLKQKSAYGFFLYEKLKLKAKPERLMFFIDRGEINYNGYMFYFMMKLLQSSINLCDFVATGSFYSENSYELNNIIDIDGIKKRFQESSIYKSIKDYEEKKGPKVEGINKYRNQMFLEADKNLKKKPNSTIYNLEMPTGGGKTFVSANLGLELIGGHGLDRFIYIFPFNTLSSQTKDVLDELSFLDFKLINSVTPITMGEKLDYSEALINRQSWNYDSIISSHVAFFDIIFSGRRESSLAFLNMMNSVIILDEIQVYKNTIWTEIIEGLYEFGQIMNSKVIIMSATNPHLDKLISYEGIKKPYNVTSLIDEPGKYSKLKEFKNRVKVDASVLGKKVSCDFFLDIIREETRLMSEFLKRPSKILMEFITKKSANDFYEKAKAELKKDYLVLKLDGDTPVYERQEIIDLIKNYKVKHILLVATQVAEAGLDIDMDLGLKDVTTMDSEEQFTGRINRSGKNKHAKIIFFDKDNEKMIYRGDLRINSTIKNEKYLKQYEEKDFKSYYEELMGKIRSYNQRLGESNIELFYIDLLKSNFKKISSRMRLINDENFRVFVPKTINLRGETIDGDEVWDEYVNLVENKEGVSYAEMRVRLSHVLERVDYFTSSRYSNDLEGIEPVGGIYYLKEDCKKLV